MDKKKICLIATGGTIASVETPEGMKPLLDGKALLAKVPELESLGVIDIVELMQLDSTNIQPKDWIQMAQAIEERYADYDGFIITHGTDTMAHSAAALYYMLENLQKPVIFTGSQLSLVEEGSDAPANLLLAMYGAVSSVPGVYLAFHNKLMQGNAAKKLCTENFDGFYSINVPDVAVLEDGKIKWNISSDFIEPEKELKINTAIDTHVAVFEVFPGFNTDIIRMAVDSGCKGIVLKGYGAGNVPSEESGNSFLPAIDYAVEKGVKVVLTTQCIYDGTDLERYEVGASALRHGVISGGDLTVEAILAKLMLGKY
ncbi:MAG: asparaginase [Selenomonadaceae bacterium]|nr:asparaginase [Selenomonadaceae bacterium]